MSDVFAQIWRLLVSVKVPVFGSDSLTFGGLLLGFLGVSVSISILIRYFKDF